MCVDEREMIIVTSPQHEANVVTSGYVHTTPDKFENAKFAAKTDKMFSVHINRFQTVSLSIINNSSAILDQWLRKDCDRVIWLL